MCFSLGLALALAPGFAGPALAKKNDENTSGASEKNYKLGLKAFERGDYDGAVDAQLQAIYFSRNGYQPQAYYQLGLAYQAKKDYVKAYEALSKSTSQAMDKANEAHLALAQVCTSLKKFDEATQEQAKAFEGVPYKKGLWYRCKFQQASNLDAWGKNEAACGCYTEALGEEPWHTWEPWIRYAECLMKLKNWVEAYQTLDKMLTTTATVKGLDFERVHLDMGICALAKGNHQGALDNWHRVLEYNPDNKEAHLQLGLLLDSEQHLSSAITEYKYFIRMAGADDPLRVKQVETRIALLEQQLGKVDPPPAPVAPSPYMRNQQQQVQPQPVGDPGF
ncbi:MAG: tetratricopeptide repeat protein [Cyanobacteria bacterium SZAS LIN-2]|nr:tetratricopeptide repeat protein [Cyanobacteria bacterium SZAS LIN-3]MBS1995342.1 tetratricopeptide repeat protein [Cyanobacteria bacterium SZAS LIN-2]MBS2008875.1 tetratricopeptide repeat protein [Cyanobacteria bacterium SZAS TMP-1]